MSSSLSGERTQLRDRIRQVTDTDFEAVALDLFQYQARNNPVYNAYLHHLRRNPANVQTLADVPFLPISFFKTQRVLIGETNHQTTAFASSGTTGATTSRHWVPDLALYDDVSIRLFEARYGPLANYHILALLPSYLERNNSSLVYMVQRFMERSGSDLSGFYLHDTAALTNHLRDLADAATRSNVPSRRVLLIGVTFGLLDWVEATPDLRFLADLPGLVVMETGGMKGRRRELLRDEVHAILTEAMGVPAIHSEYGMTELLSQAYSSGAGVFQPSATLRIRLRDLNDPFHLYALPDPASLSPERTRQTGGVNVIDLANLDSCAFIETQDLGQYVGIDGSFRIMGRFDNSDVRGCNLLVL
ncbi:acyl transferase [Fibrella sp. WM1]|uniref:acyl transferase n=1 Tax=Fibrella musci TaxID=3242485 RepID=UPI00351FE8A7